MTTTLLVALALLSASNALQPTPTGGLLRFRHARLTVGRSDAGSASEAAPPPAPRPLPDVGTFFEAEDVGLQMFKAGDYENAMRMFEKSMSLPGSGRDFNRARSGGGGTSAVGGAPNPGGGLFEQVFASKEEVQCAKYNMACCQTAMGNTQRGLELLEEVLDSGFTDFDTIRKDSTLSKLGAAQLDQLIEKYKPEGLFGFLGGSSKPAKAAESSKPMELPKITFKGLPNPFAKQDS
eukprot:CAMPEP_0119502570 /NCGR_PEP_ID=MMETSP1344-20130328/23996_1 /TAXON_ID=236787 /ORGANISM="Florenciella parvula, Strain CCMP2471" /LENGTH=235 /DNA_ID=CAMNT_0007538789 /DNA_START=26 /DNA_END=733 /DNA_ORIENTATION=-